MSRYSWSVAVLALGCAGCLSGFPALGLPFGNASSRTSDRSFLLSSECARPSDKGGQQLQAPQLITLGSTYLSQSLYLGAAANQQSTMAIDCFGRALRLVPESYEARLGMGIAYLASAKTALAPEENRNLLAGARNMLGHAYMLRHGAYEPLYYLAEVAIMEGKLSLAHQFLTPLQATGVKEGPVNMLLGRLSELEGKKQDAIAFYRKAISIGWPAETASYASSRFSTLSTPVLVRVVNAMTAKKAQSSTKSSAQSKAE
jgi:hypothetical protein